MLTEGALLRILSLEANVDDVLVENKCVFDQSVTFFHDLI